MNPKSYEDFCPVARALDILGERWTLLILRDLFRHGPCRFQDFANSLHKISPTTLSARLKRLEEHGIIKRELLEEHPPRIQYILTEKGKDLEKVIKALYEWRQKHTPSPDKKGQKP